MSSDKILGTIIIMIVLFATIAISFRLVLTKDKYVIESNFEKFNYYKTSNKLDTFLDLDEPYSHKNIPNLLFNLSLSTNKNIIQTPFGNKSINETLKPYLDFLFGNNNYYFTSFVNATPQIIILYKNTNFINKIMLKERNKLINFSNKIKNKFNTTTKLYILSINHSICNPYLNTNITCFVIFPNDVYNNSNNNLTDIIGNNIKFILNHYLNETLNSDGGFRKKLNTIKLYESSDWSTFLTKVLMLNNLPQKTNKINLIFPILFEQNLGSANLIFYLKDYYHFNYNKYCDKNGFTLSRCINDYKNWQHLSYYEKLNWNKNCPAVFQCINVSKQELHKVYYEDQYCNLNTKFNYSDILLNRTLKYISKSNNNYIYPLYSFPKFEATINIMNNSYIKRYNLFNMLLPELYGGNPDTLCGKEDCPACFENQTTIILHNETKKHFLEQLNKIIKVKNTQKYKFTSMDNLLKIIQDQIQSVNDKMKVTIGKKEKTPYYVFNRKYIYRFKKEPIALNIYFEYYNNNYYFNNSESKFFEIIPYYELEGIHTFGGKKYLVAILKSVKNVSNITIDENIKPKIFPITSTNLVTNYLIFEKLDIPLSKYKPFTIPGMFYEYFLLIDLTELNNYKNNPRTIIKYKYIGGNRYKLINISNICYNDRSSLCKVS